MKKYKYISEMFIDNILKEEEINNIETITDQIENMKNVEFQKKYPNTEVLKDYSTKNISLDKNVENSELGDNVKYIGNYKNKYNPYNLNRQINLPTGFEVEDVPAKDITYEDKIPLTRWKTSDRITAIKNNSEMPIETVHNSKNSQKVPITATERDLIMRYGGPEKTKGGLTPMQTTNQVPFYDSNQNVAGFKEKHKSARNDINKK